MIGYGSFAVIVIRSNANTPLDENDPENLVTLHSYLKREQYGSSPILSGPHWNSKANTSDEFEDISAYHLRRWVVVDNNDNNDLKGFVNQEDAKKWAQKEYKNDIPENVEIKENTLKPIQVLGKMPHQPMNKPPYSLVCIYPQIIRQTNQK